MPGPAPTPTAMLEARGSWRAGLRKDEPRPPVEGPSCPAWLSKEARAEWRRQVKALKAMGVLAKCDRALLAAYCEAWAEFVELSDLIKVVSIEEAIEMKLVRYRNLAADRLLKLGQQFGFSPASRTRVQAAAGSGKTEDPLDAFLRGKHRNN